MESNNVNVMKKVTVGFIDILGMLCSNTTGKITIIQYEVLLLQFILSKI